VAIIVDSITINVIFVIKQLSITVDVFYEYQNQNQRTH